MAPRFGLTYNPDGKGKTLIRTGYGIFYDKIFLLVARNALLARQTLQPQLGAGHRALPAGRLSPEQHVPHRRTRCPRAS